MEFLQTPWDTLRSGSFSESYNEALLSSQIFIALTVVTFSNLITLLSLYI